MEMYCYVGDVKKLIPAGFKFQKLYASNYKSYHKDHLFMFVVTKMALEISNVNHDVQHVLVKFILDHKDKPESFWHSKREHSFFKDTLFANWVIQNGVIVTYNDAVKNKSEWFKKFKMDESIKYLEDGIRLDIKLVRDILKLNEIGAVELRDIDK